MTSPQSAALVTESLALSLPFSQEPGTPVANKERGLRCQHCGAELPKKLPDMEMALQILGEVSAEHGITISQMQGRGRMVEFVDARSCVSKRWREELDLPLKNIGYLLGGRDHSTIINLLKRIPKMEARLGSA